MQASQPMPENLWVLMNGDQTGFVLKRCYMLYLKHNLMGFFPALIRAAEATANRLVVTSDHALIKDVWRTLPPRESGIAAHNLYINPELGIGYFMPESAYDSDKSRPHALLSRADFEVMTKSNPRPFEWHLGLISKDIDRSEFMRTIEAATKHP